MGEIKGVLIDVKFHNKTQIFPFHDYSSKCSVAMEATKLYCQRSETL